LSGIYQPECSGAAVAAFRAGEASSLCSVLKKQGGKASPTSKAFILDRLGLRSGLLGFLA